MLETFECLKHFALVASDYFSFSFCEVHSSGKDFADIENSPS